MLSRDRCQQLNNNGRAASPKRKIVPIPISMDTILEPYDGKDGRDFTDYFNDFLWKTEGFPDMDDETKLSYLTLFLRGDARKVFYWFKNDPTNKITLGSVAKHMAKWFDQPLTITSRQILEFRQQEGQDFRNYTIQLRALVNKCRGALYRDPEYQKAATLMQAKDGVLTRYITTEFMNAKTIDQAIEAYQDEWDLQAKKEECKEVRSAITMMEDSEEEPRCKKSSERRRKWRKKRRIRSFETTDLRATEDNPSMQDRPFETTDLRTTEDNPSMQDRPFETTDLRQPRIIQVCKMRATEDNPSMQDRSFETTDMRATEDNLSMQDDGAKVPCLKQDKKGLTERSRG